jgi:hypothetical protein
MLTRRDFIASAAYSFNKLLNDSIKGRGPGVTLVQVLEFAAKNKFDGFDATGYFFPGYPAVPSDAYLHPFLDVPHSGVANRFSEVAARLGEGLYKRPGAGVDRCRSAGIF